jgi:hypothetical protein
VTGKHLFRAVVEIPDRGGRERFQQMTQAAIQRLIDSEAG